MQWLKNVTKISTNHRKKDNHLNREKSKECGLAIHITHRHGNEKQQWYTISHILYFVSSMMALW